MKSFKKNTLYTVCQRAMIALFATSVASHAYAQQAAQDESEDVEVIEVQGSRDALAKALDRKRESKNVVDAIIAEDIGKMPDENIAEALQRITGISIQRDMGEGTSVNIRGMGSDFNQVKVNGQTLTSGGNGRDIDFSSMSADLLAAIEVVKTPSAKHEEGSIGGTINLNTRKPLNIKAKQVVNFNFKAAYNEITQRTDPNAALNITRKFTDDFGVSASLTAENRQVRQDQYFTRSWRPIDLRELSAVDSEGNVVARDAENQDAIMGNIAYSDNLYLPWNPTEGNTKYNIENDADGIGWHAAEFGSRLDIQDRERIGSTLNIQYRPNDDTDLQFDVFFSQLTKEQTYYQNWYKFRLVEDPEFSNMLENLAVDESGTFTSADFLHTTNQQSTSRSDRRGETVTNSLSFKLRGEHRFDNLTVNASAGYSQSREKNDNESQFLFAMNGATHGYRISDLDLLEVVSAGDNFVAPDENPHRLSQIRDNYREVKDDAYEAQIDFDYMLDGDFFSSVEFGAKWTERTKHKDDDSTYIKMWLEDIENTDKVRQSFIDQTNSDGEVISTPVPFPVSDFMDGRGTDLMTREWGIIDFDTAIDNASTVFGVDSFDELPFGKYRDYRNSYDLNIETQAAYAQINIDGLDGLLVGDLGVRAVKTIRNARGYSGNQANILEYRPGLDNFARLPVIDYRDVIVEKEYDNILPSLNLRYALGEETLVRFAASKVMARPNFWEIAPYVKQQPLIDIPRMWAGNPNLDPFEADQADLTYEWYYGKGASLTVGAFYKNITSFYYNSVTSNVTLDANGEPLWLGVDGNPTPFVISQPQNGAGGEIRGLEAAFQQNFDFLPGKLSNFGTLVNYTFSDSSADYLKRNLLEQNEQTGEVNFQVNCPIPDDLELPFINQSKHSANAAIYYEQKGFSSRLAYSYRSDSLVTPQGNFCNAHWNKGYGQLDFSLNWNVKGNVNLILNVVNMTNEAQKQYATGIMEGNALEDDLPENRLLSLRQAGRIVRLGVNVRF